MALCARMVRYINICIYAQFKQYKCNTLYSKIIYAPKILGSLALFAQLARFILKLAPSPIHSPFQVHNKTNCLGTLEVV